MISVHATADKPPYREYAAANKDNPRTPVIKSIPSIVCKARPPKYKTEARFTNT